MEAKIKAGQMPLMLPFSPGTKLAGWVVDDLKLPLPVRYELRSTSLRQRRNQALRRGVNVTVERK